MKNLHEWSKGFSFRMAAGAVLTSLVLAASLPVSAVVLTGTFAGTGDNGSVGAGFFTYDDTQINNGEVDEVDLLGFSWEVTSGPSAHGAITNIADIGVWFFISTEPVFDNISLHILASSGHEWIPTANNESTKTATDEVFTFQYTGLATVPVPAAVWLFGSGLLGLAAITRRKKAYALTALFQ